MNAKLSTPFNPSYIAGETASLAVDAPAAAAVEAVFGNSSIKLAKDDAGIWRGRIPTAKLLGPVRYTVFAEDADGNTSAVAHGSFTVMCAGRSKLRDVIDKIDEAIRTWGTNPNRSISAGEINITYKTLDELVAVRAQYVQRAEEEETGRALTGGVRVMEVHF